MPWGRSKRGAGNAVLKKKKKDGKPARRVKSGSGSGSGSGSSSGSSSSSSSGSGSDNDSGGEGAGPATRKRGTAQSAVPAASIKAKFSARFRNKSSKQAAAAQLAAEQGTVGGSSKSKAKSRARAQSSESGSSSEGDGAANARRRRRDRRRDAPSRRNRFAADESDGDAAAEDEDGRGAGIATAEGGVAVPVVAAKPPARKPKPAPRPQPAQPARTARALPLTRREQDALRDAEDPAADLHADRLLRAMDGGHRCGGGEFEHAVRRVLRDQARELCGDGGSAALQDGGGGGGGGGVFARKRQPKASNPGPRRRAGGNADGGALVSYLAQHLFLPHARQHSLRLRRLQERDDPAAAAAAAAAVWPTLWLTRREFGRMLAATPQIAAAMERTLLDPPRLLGGDALGGDANAADAQPADAPEGGNRRRSASAARKASDEAVEAAALAREELLWRRLTRSGGWHGTGGAGADDDDEHAAEEGGGPAAALARGALRLHELLDFASLTKVQLRLLVVRLRKHLRELSEGSRGTAIRTLFKRPAAAGAGAPLRAAGAAAAGAELGSDGSSGPAAAACGICESALRALVSKGLGVDLTASETDTLIGCIGGLVPKLGDAEDDVESETARAAAGIERFRVWLNGDASAPGSASGSAIPSPRSSDPAALKGELGAQAREDAAPVVDLTLTSGSDVKEWAALSARGFVRVPVDLNHGNKGWRSSAVHVWFLKSGSAAASESAGGERDAALSCCSGTGLSAVVEVVVSGRNEDDGLVRRGFSLVQDVDLNKGSGGEYCYLWARRQQNVLGGGGGHNHLAAGSRPAITELACTAGSETTAVAAAAEIGRASLVGSQGELVGGALCGMRLWQPPARDCVVVRHAATSGELGDAGSGHNQKASASAAVGGKKASSRALVGAGGLPTLAAATGAADLNAGTTGGFAVAMWCRVQHQGTREPLSAHSLHREAAAAAVTEAMRHALDRGGGVQLDGEAEMWLHARFRLRQVAANLSQGCAERKELDVGPLFQRFVQGDSKAQRGNGGEALSASGWSEMLSFAGLRMTARSRALLWQRLPHDGELCLAYDFERALRYSEGELDQVAQALHAAAVKDAMVEVGATERHRTACVVRASFRRLALVHGHHGDSGGEAEEGGSNEPGHGAAASAGTSTIAGAVPWSTIGRLLLGERILLLRWEMDCLLGRLGGGGGGGGAQRARAHGIGFGPWSDLVRGTSLDADRAACARVVRSAAMLRAHIRDRFSTADSAYRELRGKGAARVLDGARAAGAVKTGVFSRWFGSQSKLREQLTFEDLRPSLVKLWRKEREGVRAAGSGLSTHEHDTLLALIDPLAAPFPLGGGEDGSSGVVGGSVAVAGRSAWKRWVGEEGEAMQALEALEPLAAYLLCGRVAEEEGDSVDEPRLAPGFDDADIVTLLDPAGHGDVTDVRTCHAALLQLLQRASSHRGGSSFKREMRLLRGEAAALRAHVERASGATAVGRRNATANDVAATFSLRDVVVLAVGCGALAATPGFVNTRVLCERLQVRTGDTAHARNAVLGGDVQGAAAAAATAGTGGRWVRKGDSTRYRNAVASLRARLRADGGGSAVSAGSGSGDGLRLVWESIAGASNVATISIARLVSALQEWYDMPSKDTKKMASRLDMDSDGKLSLKEFEAFAASDDHLFAGDSGEGSVVAVGGQQLVTGVAAGEVAAREEALDHILHGLKLYAARLGKALPGGAAALAAKFHEADKEGGGYLELSVFRRVVSAVGLGVGVPAAAYTDVLWPAFKHDGASAAAAMDGDGRSFRFVDYGKFCAAALPSERVARAIEGGTAQGSWLDEDVRAVRAAFGKALVKPQGKLWAKQFFKKADVDKNGKLDAAEFERFLLDERWGLQKPQHAKGGGTAPTLKRSHVRPLLALFDRDADGFVDWREFIDFVLYCPFQGNEGAATAPGSGASDAGVAAGLEVGGAHSNGISAASTAMAAALERGTSDAAADGFARRLRQGAQRAVRQAAADPRRGFEAVQRALQRAVGAGGAALGSVGGFSGHGGGLDGRAIVAMLRGLRLLLPPPAGAITGVGGAGMAAEAAAAERLLRCFDAKDDGCVEWTGVLDFLLFCPFNAPAGGGGAEYLPRVRALGGSGEALVASGSMEGAGVDASIVTLRRDAARLAVGLQRAEKRRAQRLQREGGGTQNTAQGGAARLAPAAMLGGVLRRRLGRGADGDEAEMAALTRLLSAGVSLDGDGGSGSDGGGSGGGLRIRAMHSDHARVLLRSFEAKGAASAHLPDLCYFLLHRGFVDKLPLLPLASPAAKVAKADAASADQVQEVLRPAALLHRVVTLLRRSSATVAPMRGGNQQQHHHHHRNGSCLGQFDFEPIFRRMNRSGNGRLSAQELRAWMDRRSLAPRSATEFGAIYSWFCGGGERLVEAVGAVGGLEGSGVTLRAFCEALLQGNRGPDAAAADLAAASVAAASASRAGRSRVGRRGEWQSSSDSESAGDSSDGGYPSWRVDEGSPVRRRRRQPPRWARGGGADIAVVKLCFRERTEQAASSTSEGSAARLRLGGSTGSTSLDRTIGELRTALREHAGAGLSGGKYDFTQVFRGLDENARSGFVTLPQLREGLHRMGLTRGLSTAAARGLARWMAACSAAADGGGGIGGDVDYRQFLALVLDGALCAAVDEGSDGEQSYGSDGEEDGEGAAAGRLRYAGGVAHRGTGTADSSDDDDDAASGSLDAPSQWKRRQRRRLGALWRLKGFVEDAGARRAESLYAICRQRDIGLQQQTRRQHSADEEQAEQRFIDGEERSSGWRSSNPIDSGFGRLQDSRSSSSRGVPPRDAEGGDGISGRVSRADLTRAVAVVSEGRFGRGELDLVLELLEEEEDAEAGRGPEAAGGRHAHGSWWDSELSWGGVDYCRLLRLLAVCPPPAAVGADAADGSSAVAGGATIHALGLGTPFHTTRGGDARMGATLPAGGFGGTARTAVGHDLSFSVGGGGPGSGAASTGWQSRLARDKAWSVRQREKQVARSDERSPPPPLGSHYAKGGELDRSEQRQRRRRKGGGGGRRDGRGGRSDSNSCDDDRGDAFDDQEQSVQELRGQIPPPLRQRVRSRFAALTRQDKHFIESLQRVCPRSRFFMLMVVYVALTPSHLLLAAAAAAVTSCRRLKHTMVGATAETAIATAMTLGPVRVASGHRSGRASCHAGNSSR